MKEITHFPLYDENFVPNDNTLFHEFVIQLAYCHGHQQNPAQLLLAAVDVFKENGKKMDSFVNTITSEEYGSTLSEVAQKLSAEKASDVVHLINEKSKEFAEYVTMDLSPYIELEPGEEELTKEEISARVLTAMVVNTEYSLGRLSRVRSPKQ